MYEIGFTRKAAGFIKSLPKGQREKLRKILEVMKDNPFSHPYRKIRGETNLYRIRLGNYRVLYEINEEQKRIILLKFAKRGRIYVS